MKLTLFVVLLVVSSCCDTLELNHGHKAVVPKATCVIALDQASQWPASPPVITDANDNPVFPAGDFSLDDRTITVADGALIKLSCSGRAFSEFTGEEFATARCVGDTQFSVSTPGNPSVGSFAFVDLGCTNDPDSTSRETGRRCGPSNAGTEIDIGFETAAGHARVLTVCFDEARSKNIFAYHTLYKAIKARDTGNNRPSFSADGYFPFDVDNAYTQAQQLITITDLVGSSALGNEYVRPSESIYLARGHLSPNSDFVYLSWQDATYFFTNVGPQWQCFNAGNWVALENGVRDFVEQKNKDMVVYSGTHDVLELDDVNGNKVEIWLSPDGNALPVPKFFWKVLVDTAANTGVAFVGVNNPHLASNQIAAHKICTPLPTHPIIVDNMSTPDDIKKGLTYACRVADLAAVFDEVPNLGNLGLLT